MPVIEGETCGDLSKNNHGKPIDGPAALVANLCKQMLCREYFPGSFPQADQLKARRDLHAS